MRAKRYKTSLKTRMEEALSVLEKLSGDSYKSETYFRSQVAVVKESCSARQARVKRLERDTAVEVEKRQQLPGERRDMSLTASCQLAKDEESLQMLQSWVTTVSTELKKWRELRSKTAEKLILAQADCV